jgi:hypothetical protein
MTDKPEHSLDETTGRVMDLEAELEISGSATTEERALARARQHLHAWVDSVVAVVSTPGSGRVVLIHDDGSESRISSPRLPFLLSEPARFEPRKD